VRAVVGAPGADLIGTTDAGYVAVYKKTGSSWSFEANITAPGLTPTAQAGFSVDIEENWIVYGAPFYDGSSSDVNMGRVFIYKYSGIQWLQEYAYSEDSYEWGLGFSVCIQGGKVAAGAPNFSNKHGAVMMFIQQGDAWRAYYFFPPFSSSDGGERFGMAVSLWNDLILVGASSGKAYSYKGNLFGKALLFRTISFSSSTVHASLLNTYQSDVQFTNNFFGQSLGLDNGNLIIGDAFRPGSSGETVGMVQFGASD
jgi:hypothetical protein